MRIILGGPQIVFQGSGIRLKQEPEIRPKTSFAHTPPVKSASRQRRHVPRPIQSCRINSSSELSTRSTEWGKADPAETIRFRSRSRTSSYRQSNLRHDVCQKATNDV